MSRAPVVCSLCGGNHRSNNQKFHPKTVSGGSPEASGPKPSRADRDGAVSAAARTLWQDIREEVVSRVVDAILDEMKLSSPVHRQKLSLSSKTSGLAAEGLKAS